MSDTVKIRVWLRTDKVGSKCEEIVEFEGDDWESLSDHERDEECREIAFGMGEWGYEEVE